MSLLAPTQAVVLAAGVSKRLVPFNQLQNKPQLSLMGKSILSWTLEALQRAGIAELVVVVNPQMHFEEGYWQQWSQQFRQIDVVEQTESNGQAGALVAALPKLQPYFFVVNATHCTADTVLSQFAGLDSEIGLLSKLTDAPWLYGCVEFEATTGLVSSVLEKPQNLQTGYRLIGAYRLTKEFVVQLAGQKLHDTALEEGLATWAAQGRVKTAVITEEPPSLKYAWHLLTVKEYLWPKINFTIHQTAIIAPTALIRGKVAIGAGAVIGDFAIIEGPAYIGPGAVVGQHCIVRKGSVLEAGAQIQRHGDIANSILMADVHIHSGFVGDSIIGQGARIGAGFTTANRRLDRGEISAHVQGKKVKTGLTSLGALIGAHCHIGIQVGTMPNVILADNSVVEPGTIVKRNVGV